MAEKIEEGTLMIGVGILVRVGGGIKIPITTANREGRTYEHEKYLKAGRFLFGTTRGLYEVQREIREPVLDEETHEPVVDDVTGDPIENIVQPAKYVALVQWAGPKYRTSMLPIEVLKPAINQSKR